MAAPALTPATAQSSPASWGVVSALVAVACLCMLALAASAVAHPSAPYRTTAWAKSQVFFPGKHKFDDRAASCTGFGARRGSTFVHFRCRTLRNDGIRFSMIVHSTSAGRAEVAFVDVIGKGGYRKLVLDRKSISGDFATQVVSGSLDDPWQMKGQIYVSPDQKVTGNWTVVCSKASGAASRSGRFTAYNLTDFKIEFPFYGAESCTGSFAASIDGRGTLTVALIGYR